MVPLLILAISCGQVGPARPVTALSVVDGLVAVNGEPTFLLGQMSERAAQGRSVEELREIIEAMMTPFGMNLWIGSLGGIDFGAWNQRVNAERGIEPEPDPVEYPWLRTGPGDAQIGGQRFDLDRWNERYFADLRARVDLLNECGIVPVVGAFTEHAIDHPLHWQGHPLHPANNVNDLGLPWEDAIPELFENPRALAHEEAYLRRLMECLSGAHIILSPFGEVRAGPVAIYRRWLDLLGQCRSAAADDFLICVSGSREALDGMASHPAVDLVDVYCYHEGRYDDPELNVPEGERGIRATITEARTRYGRPAGKLYFKYGYPYADPASPWADPATGTDGGGPPSAAREAMQAVYEAGGFGLFLKMAWRRDRGRAFEPDRWSEDVREFMLSIASD